MMFGQDKKLAPENVLPEAKTSYQLDHQQALSSQPHTQVIYN